MARRIEPESFCVRMPAQRYLPGRQDALPAVDVPQVFPNSLQAPGLRHLSSHSGKIRQALVQQSLYNLLKIVCI